MRICLVYDCLFPWTVGGAERWMRALAEALAAEGHEVTYLTRLQWPAGDPPDIPGVRVIPVSRDEPLYGPDGNRTIGEPLRFGWGVLRHIARHRRDYDVIHTGAFPYFALLAAALTRRRSTVLAADWFEVWSRDYWRRYLGGVRGLIGWAVQRACIRVRHHAFVFSRLHAARLSEEGIRGAPTTLGGLYSGPLESVSDAGAPRAPLVVFAGRHIAEKRVPAIPAAVAAARSSIPGLRAVVFGDGPERPELLRAIVEAGAAEFVDAPGFVDAGEVARALRAATCLLLPSEREGYGMVLIEATAAGTPVVVAPGPDNAAAELVEEGVNGFVARGHAPDDLADALVRVHQAGPALREHTASWFASNASRLTLLASLETVLAGYSKR